jgi:tRNA U54 and U55 pseudouridine synthase Pus10
MSRIYCIACGGSTEDIEQFINHPCTKLDEIEFYLNVELLKHEVLNMED